MDDDSGSHEDFVVTDFYSQVESDNDDDAPMTKGDYRKLNQKLNDILSQSSIFITTKCEELITSHQTIIQKLVQCHVETHAYQKQLVEDSSQLIEVASLKVSNTIFEINEMKTKQVTFMNSFQTDSDDNVNEMKK